MVLEESKEIVRQFITVNHDCTLGEVTQHMSTLKDESKRLSRITTSKIIYDFASKGIVTIRKGRRGQSHHLSINQNNAFNLIDKWISETETIAQRVLSSLDIVYAQWDFSDDSKNPSELEELLRNFDLARDVLKMMIHILLLEIYTKIKSNDDKLTLSLRTINLLVKTLKYIVQPKPPLTLLELFGYSNLKVSESAKEFGKRFGIQKENFPYLAEKFNEFDYRFLSSYVRRGTS